MSLPAIWDVCAGTLSLARAIPDVCVLCFDKEFNITNIPPNAILIEKDNKRRS